VKQSLSLQSISSLRAKLSGRVIEPHDAEYDHSGAGYSTGMAASCSTSAT
jgi:hypothetical protein